ncbi:PEPxxWA-CTERM sorting domain-containing protein [Sphingomonas sp. Leaf343]|uniref:PEPxxWA-CTERM sorting domain-containing protein n=1 Tax=Sphingomonas sp. Leaf343 TaxID=1736345 RepID=UPI0006F6E53A|nr:PEPxxWA-CTERM sorting domain-containing protein [Sphingomonas sp. Leaf343]KQR81167.1 hypothetical protein ASG07_11900 [Sphingomonas sp. Leaf343]
MSIMFKTALGLSVLTIAPAAQAATYLIGPVTATASGNMGSPASTVLTGALGAGARITGIRYAMTMTASGDSYLSDLAILFGNSEDYLVRFTPARDRLEGGTVDLTGTADLVDMGLDFFLLGDGVFRLEFIDTYNAGADPARGAWTDTMFEVTYDAAMAGVPEPSSWALMILGFGALGGRMRRRGRTRVAFTA